MESASYAKGDVSNRRKVQKDRAACTEVMRGMCLVYGAVRPVELGQSSREVSIVWGSQTGASRVHWTGSGPAKLISSATASNT